MFLDSAWNVGTFFPFRSTSASSPIFGAVIGTEDAMIGAHKSFISSTYWTERTGPAAALTTLENTDKLREWTREMTLDWLAAGIRPEETILFVQSHVPQVTELHTIFSMVTPLGWLTRLPTFKEKVRQSPENVNYGLVGYPVLMAADIALYMADTVPVGVDQAPHLEFTREIVRRFNFQFGEVLVEPQAKHTEFTKVLGIDGAAKMRKSLDNHIEIASTPDEIWQRVRMMVARNEYKRRQAPPILRVRPRAFGSGRQMPIAARYV